VERPQYGLDPIEFLFSLDENEVRFEKFAPKSKKEVKTPSGLLEEAYGQS
jgi:hypothetical protein